LADCRAGKSFGRAIGEVGAINESWAATSTSTPRVLTTAIRWKHGKGDFRAGAWSLCF